MFAPILPRPTIPSCIDHFPFRVFTLLLFLGLYLTYVGSHPAHRKINLQTFETSNRRQAKRRRERCQPA